MRRQRAAGGAEPSHVRAKIGCGVRVPTSSRRHLYGNELACGWVLIGHGHAQRQCSSRAAQSHLVCKVFLFVRLQSASILANHVLGRRELRQRGSKARPEVPGSDYRGSGGQAASRQTGRLQRCREDVRHRRRRR